jgi:hypothetical protein
MKIKYKITGCDCKLFQKLQEILIKAKLNGTKIT